jgi:hypothetical protein
MRAVRALGRMMVLGLLVLASATQAAKNDLPPNSIPLSELIGLNIPIDLNGSEIIYPVFIPLTQRMSVRDVELHLEYVNSISLIGARSQMVVKLNDNVVAQVPLNPSRPEGIADIRLPSHRFEPGYNKLTFHVVQHYTYDCEDPDAPELWTQIDSHKSYVRYEGLLKRLRPRLSELPQLLDERWIGDYELNMATPTLPDQESARWAALATQSAAIHLEYKPPLVHHEIIRGFADPSAKRLKNYRFPYLEQSHFVGKDTIMVGTQSELQRVLGRSWSSKVRGPYLGVFPLDEDPRHFLLVVSGASSAEVEAAARILGYLNFPLPDQAEANFPGLTVDHLRNFAAPPLVSQNSVYRLYDFGFETTTLRGAQGGSVDIDVMLPPNTYVAETSRVKLNLHFAYGAGMRGDSVFNVFVNGRFENVIRLDQPDGEAVRRHTMYIPTRTFKPGLNTVTFAARMITDNSEECQVRNDRNLLFTLFDDSTIEFSGLDDYVQMPNMKLMANNGFPYNYNDDGGLTVVNLGSGDSLTAAASWTLLGKLAQVMGNAFTDLSYSIGDPYRDGDYNSIVVAPVRAVNNELLALAPVHLGEESLLKYARPSKTGEQPRVFGSRLWINADEHGTREFNYVEPTLDGYGLGDYGLLMQFGGGSDYGQTVTLLTALDEETLYGSVRELVTPEIWSNVAGDITAWKEGEEQVYSRTLGERYHIGSPRLSNWLIFHFSNNPWLFIVVLVIFLILLAILIRWLLKLFKNKNHS